MPDPLSETQRRLIDLTDAEYDKRDDQEWLADILATIRASPLFDDTEDPMGWLLLWMDKQDIP